MKVMQEAKLKTKQKAQKKPKASSSKAFTADHAEMSEFLDASEDIKVIPR
jgi:hypothetical protein